MSTWRYITASLWHFKRIHATVAAGVAVATAVITGALLVGDSVRGSLRDLSLERLGNVIGVLVGEKPFRAELAEDLDGYFEGNYLKDFAPLLLIPGSMSLTGGEPIAQATQLSILGVTDKFWQLGDGELAGSISGDDTVITQAIADELNVGMGDEVLLRVAMPSTIPADSTLGEKADATIVRRLKIAGILNQGIARFSLQPSQLEPRNVFVSLTTLQRLLDIPGKANVIAVVPERQTTDSVYSYEIYEADVFQLADFGLQLDEFIAGNNRYVQLSAEQLVLPPYMVELTEKKFDTVKPQAVVTYLANSINLGEKKIPYSTVTGVDSTSELGPLRDEAGQPIVLAENEVALNDWAAARLAAKIGDSITIKYYEPETTHGQLIERSTKPLTVKLIAPLEDTDGQPTAVADEHFTPELPGVTDERSISDWDLPFRLIEKISQEDEDYWDEYRTTPKAFVSLALAKKLWSTRWGTISALRFPISNGVTPEQIESQLTESFDPAALGMRWLAVREQGLAAARGTTSFEGLFLGFSFFLMASAVMLISLLFRLGTESRAREVGILSATGWSTERIRQAWLVEGAVVAVIGAAIGTLAGIAYAAIMIFGLNTWWVTATVTPFLKLHVNPMSLAIGFAVGLFVAIATIALSLRKLTRLEPRQLLAGDTSNPQDVGLAAKPQAMWLSAILIVTAMGVGVFAIFSNLQDEAQAGAFFGSGALVLAALVLWLHAKLRQPDTSIPQSLALTELAIRNARRNPSRTLLSVSLAAVASFLIVAISAFRLSPTEEGTGGFDLVARADLPLFFDLGTVEGRRELGFPRGDEVTLDKMQVVSCRVRGGEDASCLNLYQTAQPTVVGVPRTLYSNKTFNWSGSIDPKNNWRLLDQTLDNDAAGRPIVPVVLDKNTASYSLHLSGIGARFTIHDAFDQEVTLEVVGLLAGSILQGNVLISEGDFLRLFPDVAGQRLFLIRTGGDTAKVAALLENQLVDYGFDAVNASQRLAEFMAVQNTYLSTFQSLGALGLLLGTVGLAVSQLRSVVERRGELALMRSVGFRRRRLAGMVLGENLSLLSAGLGFGCLAAGVATLPHWWLARAEMPWGTLAALLVIIAISGVAAGWLAVRAAVLAPLLAALRGE